MKLESDKTLTDFLPSYWQKQRAKFLFRERKDLSADGSEELLSASHITGITKRSEKDVGMFMAETNEGYKIVKAGDAVINTMWAWMGAMGVSPIDGIISPSYGVYYPLIENIDSRYYDYLFRSIPFVTDVNRRSKGVWSSRLRLYPDAFLDMLLPLPDISAQKQIADFLDEETLKIDKLIDKKQNLISLIRPKWEAIIYDSLNKDDTQHVRFDYISKRKNSRVIRKSDESYTPLGLLNRGRGFFKKPNCSGSDLGDSEFFWVESGDLVLSGQFAWEGAVSYAGSAENGCVVSHRYPIYVGSRGVSTQYLFAYLRTEPGQFILSESSRGAAGRNRPLNTNLLEKEKIPVPNAEVQKKVAEYVNYEKQLSARMSASIDALYELKKSIITEAVTGQLDIKAWKKKGGTDKCLDNINESILHNNLKRGAAC